MNNLAMNRRAILGVLLAFAVANSHEGHDHAETPAQEAAATGPIHVSPEARKNLDIRTAEAVIQAIEKTIKATGTVQAIPGTRETVSSRISGKVVGLRVALGQFRKKGEVLFHLEARQLAENPVRVPVTAPRSGKVVKLHVIEGDAVEPGTAMLELADYGEVYAVAKIYESQIGRIDKGMAARVYSPVLKGMEMASKVDLIGSEVHPQGRTVDVWVRVKNPEEKLKINMTVNVFFLTDREDEGITIPRSAVLGSGGDRFVFVEEGDHFVRTPVVSGLENDKWIEIVEGLAPGDIVVTQGNYQLQYAKPNASAHADSGKKSK